MKALHKETNTQRAVKVIKKSKVPEGSELLKTELEISALVDHPNIVKTFEVFEDHKYIYIVLEVLTGGELFEEAIERGPYTEDEARERFVQIITVIDYLHSLGVCHRDIKPENFLFVDKDTRTLKLIDFGASKRFEVDSDKLISMKTKVGAVSHFLSFFRSKYHPSFIFSLQNKSLRFSSEKNV